VIVAGGGPAGCTAAAAAARDGARTLLVETGGCLGGTGTAGMVPAWMAFGDRQKMIVRGMAQRVFDECNRHILHVQPAMGMTSVGGPSWTPPEFWGPIDAELLKRVYDELVTGNGASIAFHTRLAGVEMCENANDTVEAVVLADKSGLRAAKAKVYVDCTGDGDLAAWAGAEFLKGAPQTGELMPATLCFMLANVDTYAYLHGKPLFPHVAQQILESSKYPEIPDSFIVPTLVGPGVVGLNAGHIWDVDPQRPETVSRAMVEGRRIADAFRRAFAEFHPAFAHAHLVATAPILGVRESRRIVGDYVLTIEDYRARRGFDDEICRNAYGVDVHRPKGVADRERMKKKVVWSRHEGYLPGESHGIPYRCLTPKGLRNVLVAGRCVSAERPVQGAVRIMSVCMGMGEAAGVAAALAARKRRPDVHAVDPRALCRRLVKHGAYLPDAKTSARRNG